MAGFSDWFTGERVMKTSLIVGLGLLVTMLTSVSAEAQQTFDLVEPTGEVTAIAKIQSGQILVQSLAGQRASFSRDPSLDSLGGEFIGYYSPKMNRALRFPRSGSGVMQTAGLGDPRPRFINTRRTVRLRRGQVVPPWTLGPPFFFRVSCFPAIQVTCSRAIRVMLRIICSHGSGMGYRSILWCVVTRPGGDVHKPFWWMRWLFLIHRYHRLD